MVGSTVKGMEQTEERREPVGPEGTGPGGQADASGQSGSSSSGSSVPSGSSDVRELQARERAVLAMERRGFAGPGAKEREIRERLGLAPVRYYQLLNALLDDPRALAHDPVTVNRLRRVREARRAER